MTVSGRMGVEEHRNWNEVDYSKLVNGRAFHPTSCGAWRQLRTRLSGNTNNWTRFEPRSKSGQKR